jgi:hypothetical protein
MKDGHIFSKYIPIAKGNPGNELSEKELKNKFLRLVEPLSGSKEANTLMSALLNCDEIADSRELGNLLRRASLEAFLATTK